MTETTVEPTATEDTAATSTAATDAGKPKPDHSGFQRRIDQLTREKHDLRRQLDAVRAPKQEPTEPTADKTLADFDYDEKAFAKHIRQVSTEEARKAARGVLDEDRQKQTQESRAKTWQQRSKQFATEHPDFTTKVYADDVHFSESITDAITESDHGPAIAYYLADNPEELERISKMSAANAGRAIGRLESKFEAKQEATEVEAKEADAEEEPKEEKRVTKAPEPPPKIGGASTAGASISTTSAASDKLSDDEWFRREQQRVSKLRKG
jgi:hypothetical protein